MVSKMPLAVSILLMFCVSGFATNVRHAVIMVMDGVRYTQETWGEATHANIPKIDSLSKLGAVLTQFYTKKAKVSTPYSETNPGHARLTTGKYQDIANDGVAFPDAPGMFQYYRQQTGKDSLSGWVITSKDKLHILSNASVASGWRNLYRPAHNSGVNDSGSGYRRDSLTHAIVLQKLTADHPALMIVNYQRTDSIAHAGNFAGYIAAIKMVDNFALDVWKAIQGDPLLKDSTLLFVLNDHGRHTTDYTSHGDTCIGCRHIMCLLLGPHVKRNHSSDTVREQIDVAPTIAKLMGFTMATAAGVYMHELFDTLTTGTIVKGKSAEMDNHLNVAFNPSTKGLSIRYKVGSSGMVTLTIVDLRGRKIETLICSTMQPGSYTMQWNASRLNSGTYYCSLGSGSYSEAKKLTIVR
jgi:predicted secreted protein